MINLKKYVTTLSVLISLLFFSCRDDISLDNSQPTFEGERDAVEFIIGIEDFFSTRGVDNPKRSFTKGQNINSSEGDVIHIQATFHLNSTVEESKREEIRYGALKLTTNGWIALGNNPMTWPNAAETGEFIAYYIPVSNGVLINNDSPLSQRLDEIDPSNDPLMAQTNPIEYGNAIKLDFYHICAYLSIVDMDEGVAPQFMFTSNPAEGRFNNAYQISLTNNILEFEFIQDTQGQQYGNGEVYLLANLTDVKVLSQDGNQSQTVKGLNYFLQPGDYSNFSLMYPRTATTFYDYLSFNYDAENFTESPKPILIKNTPYVLSVTQSSGIIIDNPQDEDQWDETEDYYDIDVEDFLKAIAEGTNYINKEGTQILEATTGGNTRLLHNVDFKNYPYVLFENNTFSPNVTGSTVFDGGYHYIKNLGCPLFRYNYGTIQNLGIDGVNTQTDVISSQYTGSLEETSLLDNSRNGIICDWNRDSGVITNIRIKGEVTFNVKIMNDPNYEGLEVHNVGGLVGSNSNVIDGIDINASSFNITVSNFEENVGDNTVVIGGLFGQNAGSASSITLAGGNNLITNKCEGNRASFFVGGGVGSNSGSLSDINLIDIQVDCSESVCVRSYVGGFAGSLETENNSTAQSKFPGILKGCLISGSVMAGKIINDYNSSLNSESYIGGMAGLENTVSLTQCRSACSVNSPIPELLGNAIYGTGGIFGRIIQTDTSTVISELIAFGEELTGPESPDGYIGSFAGILPAGQTWENNYSNRGIVVKTFGINEVGGSF